MRNVVLQSCIAYKITQEMIYICNLKYIYVY